MAALEHVGYHMSVGEDQAVWADDEARAVRGEHLAILYHPLPTYNVSLSVAKAMVLISTRICTVEGSTAATPSANVRLERGSEDQLSQLHHIPPSGTNLLPPPYLPPTFPLAIACIIRIDAAARSGSRGRKR